MSERRKTTRSFSDSAEALDRLLAPIIASAVKGERGWFPVAKLADAAHMNRTDALAFLRKINHPDSLIEMQLFPSKGWHVRMAAPRVQDPAFQNRFAERLLKGVHHSDAKFRELCQALVALGRGDLLPMGAIGRSVGPRMFDALSARVARDPELLQAVLETGAQIQAHGRNSREP